MRRNIGQDFQIVSSRGSVDVSFHMMAVNCRLFRDNQFPERRYETSNPAPLDVLRTFVECVYNLAIDPEAIKPAITPDNMEYLTLLAEEFDCPRLQEIITERSHELSQRNEGQITENINRLARAIEAQQGEVCTKIERILAADIEESLKHLKEIPLSRIPLSSLHRIIANGIERNPGRHMDRLLCDFILTKVDTEESADVCVLVNFLHIDRLSWEQVQRLFSNRKMENRLCHDFPVRFLNEMIAAVNSQQQRFEAQMIQHMADLQAENEEYKRLLGDEVEVLKRELEAMVAGVEAQVTGLSADRPPGGDNVTELERRLQAAEQGLANLQGHVARDCVKCNHAHGPGCAFRCDGCGRSATWFSTIPRPF